jgi:4-hydroxybenzoate polyprenyltransferase
LIFPQNLFSYKTIIVFFANLFFTTFVYTINDVEDSENDYNDKNKRERNPVSKGDLSKKQGYLISFSLLLAGLSLLLLLNYTVFLLGLFFGLVAFLYSWKPVRLKSLPFLDVISHVICLGILQFSITYLTFKSLDFKILPFFLIIAPFSAAVEVFQELRDFEIDRKTKIKNTVQKIGKFNPKKLIIILSIIVTLGFTLLFNAGYLDVSMIFLIPFIFLVAVIYLEYIFKSLNSISVYHWFKSNH